ncbi:diguanylate cyclase [Eubacteriaceae bacterium ES3]|nr:diguanylate cyclase [Eubacteriaceae bacterium ES3]
MDFLNVLLKFCVFMLPTIAIIYVVTGIKLYKEHPEERYRYFSGLMFSAACYAMGYFFALNANDENWFLAFRSLAYLGAIFVPAYGILFVSAFTELKKSKGMDFICPGVSLIVWLIYLTNPYHHFVYKRLEMVAIDGFSIASTQKYIGFYLIFLYFLVFIIFSIVVLFKKLRSAKSIREAKNYRFLFWVIQLSWVGVFIILMGLDTYFDPAAVIIIIISGLIGLNEVRNDLLDLSVSRWKKTVASIEEMALLIEDGSEIVAHNQRAEVLMKKYPNQEKLIRMLQSSQGNLDLIIGREKRHLSIRRSAFSDKREFAYFILEDHTKQLQAEMALKESEEMHRLLVTQMTQGLLVMETRPFKTALGYDLICLDINPRFELVTGYQKKELVGRSILKNIEMDYPSLREIIYNVALLGEQVKAEYYSEKLQKYFDLFFYSPRKNECAVVATDISERKSDEQAIRYISYHDYLTGLYNRHYFEEEIKRLDIPESLPISLIMADVNGLKLINDSLGHRMGDRLLEMAAEILNTVCSEEGFIARLGGDEFMLVLPHTDVFEAEEIIEELRTLSSSKNVENCQVSISFGSGTKNSADEEILSVYRLAENDMYQQKLYESSSVKNKTIHLVMNMLFEKSNREMRHSERVSELSILIGIAMGLNQDRVSQLGVAGLMHDIGKMGIEEWILNKKGSLNNLEYDAIKKHPEIGCRILSSTEEFERIANFVLEHHEKWDGSGYPRGIKGSEISLEARIIGVADAYDAMTCDRSYRTGLSRAEAVLEIENGSGSQFDPGVAEIFISKVLPEIND